MPGQETSLQEVLGRIPYLAPHRLQVEATGGEVRVLMALRPELTNHVGTLHAGALFTVAETAAGVAAWRIVPGDRAFVLLRSVTVRYTRRAESSVVATARVGAEEAASARSAFDAAGRADARVEVRATDEGGETVLEASFDYAMRLRKP